MKILLPSLNISCSVFFDQQKKWEDAEKKMYRRKVTLEQLIFHNRFAAMSRTKSNGSFEILSLSTRPGIRYQLSYFDKNGVAIMHENYIKEESMVCDKAVHSKDELLMHFTLYDEDLLLDVIFQ